MMFDCNNVYSYTYEPIQLIFYFVIFVYNDLKYGGLVSFMPLPH